ncbi:hypothetical protein [Micromonospora fulviviridis]|uniref:hypothetical protein n=1 Tax=Micromonospora fulviviridis TaxID=47860 RepID=UPI0037880D5B
MAAGLTDAEFAGVETQFGFELADDHRGFLAAGLPVDTRPQPREPGAIDARPQPWPDWRDGHPATHREQPHWSVQEALFRCREGFFPLG